MTHFTLEMDEHADIVSGVSRAWASASSSCRCRRPPSPRWRRACAPKARALYSLIRNIGSSVGISIVQALLTRGTAEAHANLATFVTRGNPGPG